MYLKDLNGKMITVTDLEKAIAQAADYKMYGHTNPTHEQARFDKERQLYWNDMHNKLLQLQSNIYNGYRPILKVKL